MSITVLYANGGTKVASVPTKAELLQMLGAEKFDKVPLADGRIMYIDAEGHPKNKMENERATELFRSVVSDPRSKELRIVGDVALVDSIDFLSFHLTGSVSWLQNQISKCHVMQCTLMRLGCLTSRLTNSKPGVTS